MCALIRFCYNSFWWVKFINRLAFGRWLLAVGFWLLAVSFWLLAFGC